MPRKASTEAQKVVKKIPASENGVGVSCKCGLYQITQNPEKKKHTLWKTVEGGFEKIKTADTPYDLYNLIEW